MPDEKLNEILKNIEYTKYTDKIITDPDKLRKELDETLIRGYGIDNGELMADMICVSAPVFIRKGGKYCSNKCVRFDVKFSRKKI